MTNFSELLSSNSEAKKYIMAHGIGAALCRLFVGEDVHITKFDIEIERHLNESKAIEWIRQYLAKDEGRNFENDAKFWNFCNQVSWSVMEAAGISKDQIINRLNHIKDKHGKVKEKRS
jgi:hypothetical protein